MTFRDYLRVAVVAASVMPLTARAADESVRIGVLTDLSSFASTINGEGSVESVRMAVEDAGGTVLGRKIEILAGDHQHKPDVALSVARQWFDRERVDAIADLPNSAVALGVAALAEQKNRIALISAAGTSDLTNKSCSPNSVHFQWDTFGLAKAISKAAGANKKWFLLIPDYAFGHQLQADITRFVKESGGMIVDTVRHPNGLSDFSSYLLRAQNSGADVIAIGNSGNDMVNTLKQAAEYGIGPLRNGQNLAAFVLTVQDVRALGLDVIPGLFVAVSTYWNLTDETRDWAQRFFKRRGVMPNQLQMGAYTGVTHYLKAVKAANTTDATAVMAKMRDIPINDAFVKNGVVRQDGKALREMYLMQVKKPSDSKADWDYYDLISTVAAAEASRPLSESECRLVKK